MLDPPPLAIINMFYLLQVKQHLQFQTGFQLHRTLRKHQVHWCIHFHKYQNHVEWSIRLFCFCFFDDLHLFIFWFTAINARPSLCLPSSLCLSSSFDLYASDNIGTARVRQSNFQTSISDSLLVAIFPVIRTMLMISCILSWWIHFCSQAIAGVIPGKEAIMWWLFILLRAVTICFFKWGCTILTF